MGTGRKVTGEAGKRCESPGQNRRELKVLNIDFFFFMLNFVSGPDPEVQQCSEVLLAQSSEIISGSRGIIWDAGIEPWQTISAVLLFHLPQQTYV